MTASFGGMVQLHIDDGYGWMDERRVVELSGAMVGSTADLARSVRQYLLWRWIGGRRRRQPR